MKPARSLALASLAIAASALTARASGVPLLTPLQQVRYVNGTASVSDDTESDSDGDVVMAPDFDPFVGSAFASAEIFTGSATGGGAQDSQILDDGIAATGSSFSNADALGFETSAHGNGSSGLSVQFSVATTVVFRITGYLNAFDGGSASLLLHDGVTFYADESSVGPATRQDVDVLGLLPAGNYVLQVFADSPSQAEIFSPGYASAEFGITLQLEEEMGVRLCSPAVANSTGSPGSMLVVGSDLVADDDLTLVAMHLPPLANIGYFLMGTGTNTFTPPGSAGPICIAPGIQRFLPPVQNTSELGGGFQRAIGTSGPVSGLITVGSTWGFQAWHRDFQAGASNLTDAVRVTFQ